MMYLNSVLRHKKTSALTLHFVHIPKQGGNFYLFTIVKLLLFTFVTVNINLWNY